MTPNKVSGVTFDEMKALRAVRFFALLALGIFACLRADAQIFGLSVSNSPNPVLVNNPLTINILVTNETGTLVITVTNSMPDSTLFLNATNSTGGMVSNTAGTTVFFINVFNVGEVATLTLTVQPTFRGLLTNIVTIATLGSTNLTSATNVTQVGSTSTDLGVSISPPTVAVLANDWITYGVSVTNLGPNTGHGVVLTNILAPGVALIGAVPTNYTLVSNNVVFNLGDLPSGSGGSFSLTVQPTNPGVLPLVATVSDLDFNDSNPSNNIAISNLTVGAFVTGQIAASNVTTQIFDPQTGVMKQTVGISNISTNVANSARLVVSGLTNVLYNAIGTNNGNPFVQYNGTLNPGDNVNLLLEYFIPSRLPIFVPNSAYAAVPVAASTNTPPTGTTFSITLMTNLPSGGILIEFQSIPGRTYTVIYADNPGLTNALVAQPSIVAPADRTQWIDNGPPNTVSAPTNTTTRFYSVILNP
jgi:uncharacterized repeat protein (TIGR01451 family)